MGNGQFASLIIPYPRKEQQHERNYLRPKLELNEIEATRKNYSNKFNAEIMFCCDYGCDFLLRVLLATGHSTDAI